MAVAALGDPDSSSAVDVPLLDHFWGQEGFFLFDHFLAVSRKLKRLVDFSCPFKQFPIACRLELSPSRRIDVILGDRLFFDRFEQDIHRIDTACKGRDDPRACRLAGLGIACDQGRCAGFAQRAPHGKRCGVS